MAADPVVVDGANVAHEEPTGDGKPRMGNLVAMRRTLAKAGYEPVVIVDATLRHDIDDPQQLEALLDDGLIHQAPAGTAADTFVLLEAERRGCPVVSNDTFAGYREDHPWIDDRRWPYMIIDGRVLLHPEAPPAGQPAKD